VKSADLKIVNK